MGATTLRPAGSQAGQGQPRTRGRVLLRNSDLLVNTAGTSASGEGLPLPVSGPQTEAVPLASGHVWLWSALLGGLVVGEPGLCCLGRWALPDPPWLSG